MPALTLKTYQRQALDALSLFLRQARNVGLPTAWAQAMQREGLPALPYRADELGEVPCVCLRIPTGGGKTLMAAQAIHEIARDWPSERAGQTHPVVLWLVPSDTIRSQTLGALQTPGHPYREALVAAYGQAVQVVELDGLAAVSPADWGRVAVVVVATIQSLRVSNRAGRRVYAFSEAMEPHFRALGVSDALAREQRLACVEQADLDDENQSFLTARDLGRVKHSVANLLALLRPIVLVDEAHNAKTPLSLQMLQALRPSVVLDLTATPVPRKTNVLYSVSARELEAEDMIKLPIVLAEHEGGWRDAVRDALLRRCQLEAEANHEPQHLRPIVLFQAQDAGGEVTVEVLKRHLIELEHVPEREIAVATGAQRELEGVDLFDPACPLRCVITVDALREGWDCSFAYVLCSLQNLRSNQAVEQLLGRVLRMPYAQKRRSPALNRAYAHVVASSFSEAASALTDRLVEGMGFEALDVATVLVPDPGDLFGEAAAQDAPPTEMRAAVFATELPAAAAAALREVQPEVLIVPGGAPGAAVQVRLTGAVSDAQRDALLAVAPAEQREPLAREVAQHNARVLALQAPSLRGVSFAPLPRLCLRRQGELTLIERETLAEQVAFDLLGADPRPELPGFQLVEQSNLFEVYLQGARVQMKQASGAQLSLDAVPIDATENDLIRLLEAELRDPALTPRELQAWLARLLPQLLRERGFTLTGLLRSRYPLMRAIAARLDDLKAKARVAGFQQVMFGRSEAELAVSSAWEFRFEPGRYPARDPYQGRYRFIKHYYPVVGKLKVEGEEFECAKLIDAHPAVKHWVRNLERLPEFAFWLPTATDYFYPDFVAELTDGRLLVAEYKGDAYATSDDSREKRVVGDQWARASGQVFVMIEMSREGLDMRRQLDAAIGHGLK